MQFFPEYIGKLNDPLLSYSDRLKRLRLSIGLFSFGLFVSLTALLGFALAQLDNNQLAQYQREAISFVESANKRLARKRMLVNAVPTDAFNYYREIYNPVNRKSHQEISPLSELTYQQPKLSPQVTGLVGFFQLTETGVFNSPVWPWAVSDEHAAVAQRQSPFTSQHSDELERRQQTAQVLYAIINRSESIQKMLADGLDHEIPLFRMIFDAPEYFIFYRVVTLAEGKRLQGFVVERALYFSELLTDLMGDMRFDVPVLITIENKLDLDQTEYYRFQKALDDSKEPIEKIPEPNVRLQQKAVHSSLMAWPYDDIELTFTTDSLPITDAKVYLGVFALLVMLALLGCCYGFYRAGVKQLQLAEQQLNFVSSVSHELKTPLTSIRMYCEMLQQGTVMSDAHRQEYVEFIFAESERLSRLINNVLVLSALNHQQRSLHCEYTPLAVLQDLIRSKTSSLIEKHEFKQGFLNDMKVEKGVLVLVNGDAFAQIIINIVDNAIKFFDKPAINAPERQQIDFVFRQSPSSEYDIELEIRDYGNGISAEQEAKIFDLFYRGENELTRTTQGTGIGLALVQELVLAQQGSIRIERKEPGLALLLTFKMKLGLD